MSGCPATTGQKLFNHAGVAAGCGAEAFELVDLLGSRGEPSRDLAGVDAEPLGELLPREAASVLKAEDGKLFRHEQAVLGQLQLHSRRAHELQRVTRRHPLALGGVGLDADDVAVMRAAPALQLGHGRGREERGGVLALARVSARGRWNGQRGTHDEGTTGGG